MSKIHLIAAVDEQWGLGFENHLLCYLPADLQHFKQLTLGKTVLMGRRTFESIGKPLPDRRNMVLTRQALDCAGIEIAASWDEALRRTSESEILMVIGGAQLYHEAMPWADQIELTHIHHHFQADVFFPALDEKQWRCADSVFRAKDLKNPYDMTFCRYVRYDNCLKPSPSTPLPLVGGVGG